MPAAPDQIMRRENALTTYIESISTAAEAWAHQSTNGGAVWHVAVELLDDLNFYWSSARKAEIWIRPTNLIDTIAAIQQVADNPGVSTACEAATAAIVAYIG